MRGGPATQVQHTGWTRWKWEGERSLSFAMNIGTQRSLQPPFLSSRSAFTKAPTPVFSSRRTFRRRVFLKKSAYHKFRFTSNFKMNIDSWRIDRGRGSNVLIPDVSLQYPSVHMEWQIRVDSKRISSKRIASKCAASISPLVFPIAYHSISASTAINMKHASLHVIASRANGHQCIAGCWFCRFAAALFLLKHFTITLTAEWDERPTPTQPLRRNRVVARPTCSKPSRNFVGSIGH